MAFTVAIKRGIAVEAVYVASYEIVSSFTWKTIAVDNGNTGKKQQNKTKVI